MLLLLRLIKYNVYREMFIVISNSKINIIKYISDAQMSQFLLFRIPGKPCKLFHLRKPRATAEEYIMSKF